MMTTAPHHFLSGLDRDLRENLLKALREAWTHHSTGIEGNSLTLGETAYVLAEGLTIKGKPLKDHNEVMGHGRAVDWAMKFAGERRPVGEQDIFALHQLIQTDIVHDIYKPVGAWKVERNGSYGRDEKGEPIYYDFAAPADVPALMRRWLQRLNECLEALPDEVSAPVQFAELHNGFTLIHPFWDGNGRLVRILANLPLLRAGLPPIVIERDEMVRRQYIQLLQALHTTLGVPSQARLEPLEPSVMVLHELAEFCRLQWQASLRLVQMTHEHQAKRG